MFKSLKVLLLSFTIVLLLSGCSDVAKSNTSELPLDSEVEVTRDKDESIYEGPIFLGKPYKFVKEEGLQVLASEDDYIRQFSKFDYQAKFGLDEKSADFELIASIYGKALLDWNDDEMSRISRALESIEVKMQAYNFRMPEELWLINEDGSIEGGAAYTRGNAIILPRDFIGRLDETGLERLILHELFHVISRYNKDLRPEIYGIISYKECQDLVVEGDLADRLIANPDAPDLNYYIDCSYEGNTVSFIPILYSDVSDISPGESFFRYLQDDMIAVEIVESLPIPIKDEQGQYLVVSKNKLEDYYDLIGDNTGYTYHPEETMADNFVLMVLEKDSRVNDPWILEELRSIFTN